MAPKFVAVHTTLGPLAAAVDAAVQVDVAGCTIPDLQLLAERCGALARRLAAVASRAVGELDVRTGGVVPTAEGASCATAGWLRDTARVSGVSAGRQVRTARTLRELPTVAQAVLDGDVTLAHARVLTRLVGKVDPQPLRESEPALVDIARRTDPDQLAHYVRHLLATWCPPDLEADEAAAHERRYLQLTNTHHGSWRGRFELPDAAIEILRTVLEPLARRTGLDDSRTAGQRRADALTDTFDLALRHGQLPDSGGGRPCLTYISPVGSPRGVLVDVNVHPGAGCPSAPWTGPATDTQIQTLLCDARRELALHDATGQVVSLVSLTDQVSAAQRRAVTARDRCCTAKGCSRPPAFCDVHHLIRRAAGGRTALPNLVLLCRRHHVQWHRGLLSEDDLRLPWKVPAPLQI